MQSRHVATAIVVAAIAPLCVAQPISSAFTYQGELRDSDALASGLYDLQFRLFDGALGGFQIGPVLCMNDVQVIDGKCTAELDCGPVFFGSNRFVEIDVRADTGLSCASSSGFVTLSPRQRITTTPYAAYALAAAVADTATTATTAKTAGTASSATNASNLNS